MKETSADLNVEVNVECPTCEHGFNILDESECLVDYNEEGNVIKQACPDGNWCDEHEKFRIAVVCTECKESFLIKGLNW